MLSVLQQIYCSVLALSIHKLHQVLHSHLDLLNMLQHLRGRQLQYRVVKFSFLQLKRQGRLMLIFHGAYVWQEQLMTCQSEERNSRLAVCCIVESLRWILCVTLAQLSACITRINGSLVYFLMIFFYFCWQIFLHYVMVPVHNNMLQSPLYLVFFSSWKCTKWMCTSSYWDLLGICVSLITNWPIIDYK